MSPTHDNRLPIHIITQIDTKGKKGRVCKTTLFTPNVSLFYQISAHIHTIDTLWALKTQFTLILRCELFSSCNQHTTVPDMILSEIMFGDKELIQLYLLH